MKKYDDENIGFEALLPNEMIELLHTQQVATKETKKTVDSPLDEHELAMAA